MTANKYLFNSALDGSIIMFTYLRLNEDDLRTVILTVLRCMPLINFN